MTPSTPYLFTVPNRFRTEPHPLGVGPDDLFVIHAATAEDAKRGANFQFGNESWCSCYAADDPRVPELRADFYPGRIVGLDGHEVDPADLFPTTYRLHITDISQSFHEIQRHDGRYDSLEGALAAVKALRLPPQRVMIHEFADGAMVRWHAVNMQTMAIASSGKVGVIG